MPLFIKIRRLIRSDDRPSDPNTSSIRSLGIGSLGKQAPNPVTKAVESAMLCFIPIPRAKSAADIILTDFRAAETTSPGHS